MNCPRKFYYKAVLRLPDPPGIAALQGTVAHEILEELLQLPREERTPAWAESQVIPRWRDHYRRHLERGHPHLVAIPGWLPDTLRPPGAEQVSTDLPAEDAVLTSISTFCHNAFILERLTNFDPYATEQRFDVKIGSVPVRGVIDRLDQIASAGHDYLFISDYKTGKPHNPRYADQAFFAMRVYALMVQEALGITPYQLRLIYLSRDDTAEGIATMEVTDRMLADTRTQLDSIWRGIRTAHRNDHWPPRVNPLCDWCAFRDICPAWAEEVPALEEEAAVSGGDDRPR